MSLSRAFELIDREIGQLPPLPARSHETYAPPSARIPMPDYVQHQDGASQLGKLSAEAVIREYDATARNIEAMGGELKELARKTEEMIAAMLGMLKDVNETAHQVREEGKRIFLYIENCSNMTDEARRTCSEFKAKLTQPSS